MSMLQKTDLFMAQTSLQICLCLLHGRFLDLKGIDRMDRCHAHQTLTVISLSQRKISRCTFYIGMQQDVMCDLHHFFHLYTFFFLPSHYIMIV